MVNAHTVTGESGTYRTCKYAIGITSLSLIFVKEAEGRFLHQSFLKSPPWRPMEYPFHLIYGEPTRGVLWLEFCSDQ